MEKVEIINALNSFEKQLLRYANSLTKDSNSAKDLFQETAFRAIKHAKRCLPGTNTQAWLTTIMRNLYINDYRKRRRRSTLQAGQDNSFLFDVSDETISNEGESNMLYQDLIQLVHQLDDDLKVPFLMTTQGFKYEEIAKKLDIPLGTVKSRIFFARKRMQKALSKLYGANAKQVLFAA